MDDYFSFPTVAAPASAPEEKQDLDEVQFPGRLLFPTTSPLWPFSSSAKIKTTTTVEEEDEPSTSTRIGGHTQAVRQHDDEDRMDLLWEDFNDDLKLPQRPRPESSDTESEETSTTSGCARTTMLRASSRAGGVGQFCSSSSRSGRGSRTTGWNWDVPLQYVVLPEHGGRRLERRLLFQALVLFPYPCGPAQLRLP